MDVDCPISVIKNQLEKFPKSMKTHDQVHRLEIERVKKTGGKYRRGITKILTSLRKKIQRTNTSRTKREDPRTKVNGGNGRKDYRTKVNGGEGRCREDELNIVRGGIGRQTEHRSSGAESTLPSTAGCNELRDFWWNHADDAAILASCCASHEAAMHTFWSAEEWMVHLSTATTGFEVYYSSTNISSIIGTFQKYRRNFVCAYYFCVPPQMFPQYHFRVPPKIFPQY